MREGVTYVILVDWYTSHEAFMHCRPFSENVPKSKGKHFVNIAIDMYICLLVWLIKCVQEDSDWLRPQNTSTSGQLLIMYGIQSNHLKISIKYEVWWRMGCDVYLRYFINDERYDSVYTHHGTLKERAVPLKLTPCCLHYIIVIRKQNIYQIHEQKNNRPGGNFAMSIMLHMNYSC